MASRKVSKKAKKKPKRKKRARAAKFVIPAEYVGMSATRQGETTLALHFNSLCMRVAAHERRVDATRVDVLEMFGAIANFAMAHKLDPSVWIYSVFAQTGFRRAPGWKEFFSEKRTKHAEKLNARDHTLIATAKITHTPAEGFMPFRDLSLGAEAAKKSFLVRGRADLCMLAVDVTFGFHPGSDVCSSCPSREPCSTKTRALATEVAARNA